MTFLMPFAIYIKLIHILGAFLLVGGEIAREFVNRRARSSQDLKVVAEMLKLSQFFTMKVLMPAGQIVIWVGILTALSIGLPLWGFLQGATTNWVFASLVMNILIIVNIFAFMRPAGEKIGKALGAAMPKGEITPELTAALQNPTMKYAQWLEYFLLLAIIFLMVLKPF